MTDTTAKIAARNDLKHTGITPDIARKFYDRLGTSCIAIIELTSSEHTVDLEGKKTVKLEIGYVEVAEDAAAKDHLRELQQALYRQRHPQKPIDSIADQEPSVDDVVARGEALVDA